MRTFHPSLLAGALVLAAFGCSSSSSNVTNPDGGNNLPDTGSNDSGGGGDVNMPPVDGGGGGDTGGGGDGAGAATCASICMKGMGLPCYDPMRCTMNCTAAQAGCAVPGAFQTFLDCAQAATPMCDMTGMKESFGSCVVNCSVDGGNPTDQMCLAMGANCTNCCAGAYMAGATTFAMLLVSCECGANGACQTECANELCAATPMQPTPGDACDTCINNSIGADGGSGACTQPVVSGCQADPNCVNFTTCSGACP